MKSRYGSTLYGHGLTYSYIDIFNFDYHLQDFIFVTPIHAGRILYTTFLRRTLPRGRRSVRQLFVDKVVHPLLFPAIVQRLRREHEHEGHGFWEAQSRVESPILTERERALSIASDRCIAWSEGLSPSDIREVDLQLHRAIERSERSGL